MSEQRIVFDDLEIGEIAMDLDYDPPEEIVRWGLKTFGNRAAIVTSLQIDSLAVLDMAYRIDPHVQVITVDTGRLPEAMLEFLEEVRAHYPETRWKVLFPNHHEVEKMVERHGANLFYKSVSQRFLCCHIRKVRPLVSALQGLDAWFTGLRRDQWASRAAIKKIELDHDHGGMVKLNPLADWTEEEVWQYLLENGVPIHPLYEQGYTSLGCAPCSRPIEAGEDRRAGRWWWERDAPKECGMNCPIETGGFEHEARIILAEARSNGDAPGSHPAVGAHSTSGNGSGRRME
ncbi:MAG TPA: phosphoadenylyl-sulfate reductase [Anaerolineales bacterium]|nr:phosphoadenylyl-sulfate reductase [Anaerolineales bacterium]